jgi:4-hydroxythreonine-4-phosphate dehydrogenase
MTEVELFIIADDVTGAADSAARCRQAGLTAAIDLAPGSARQPVALAPTQVLALSTDSRFLSPQAAAARVATIVDHCVRHSTAGKPPEQTVRWYKKIDSTLRGNIGAELAAMLPKVTPNGHAPHALIAPAFPAQQRILVDGYLGYAQLPPRTVHLPTLLTNQCDLAVTAIALATVRAGGAALQAALATAKATAQTLIVVDAEREDDLAQLCAAADRILPHALLCGSAGLVGVWAQQLATRWGMQPQMVAQQAVSIPESAARHHPMLAVVGSGSPMAQAQIAALRGKPAITVVEVAPAQAVTTIMAQIDRALEVGRGDAAPSAVVLHLPVPVAGTALEGPLARAYAATLAEVAQALIQRIEPATLLIVGGDTAAHLLQRLGVHQLEVHHELLPGMPLTTGVDRQGHAHRIILKAGNHGDAETLVTLLQLKFPLR